MGYAQHFACIVNLLIRTDLNYDAVYNYFWSTNYERAALGTQLTNSSHESFFNSSTIRSHKIVIAAEWTIWWKFWLNWVIHLLGNLHGIHHFVNLTLISESLAPLRLLKRSSLYVKILVITIPESPILKLFFNNAIESFISVFWILETVCVIFELYTSRRTDRFWLFGKIVTSMNCINIFNHFSHF